MVQAVDALTGCTSDEKGYSESEITPSTYCLDGTTINGINTNTRKVIGKGIYLFSGNQLVEFGNAAANGEYSMYVCDENSKCVRTYGFIMKDANNYYEIKNDNSVAVDVSSTAKSEKEDSECIPGELYTNSLVKLCLATGTGIAFASDDDHITNYLMNNVGTDTGTTVFTATGANSKPKMIIQAGTTSFVLNTAITDKEYESCTDNTVLTRKQQFCSGSILNPFYDCQEGLCTLDTGNVQGTLLVEGKLYSCDGGTCQLLENAQGTGVFVFQDDPDDETYKTLLTDNEVAALSNLGDVHLYDCSLGICVPTSGYVKYATSTKIGEFNASGAYTSDKDTEECDSAGKINLAGTDLKLCISSGNLVGSSEASGKIGYIVGSSLYKITSSIIAISKHDESYFNSATNKITNCTSGTCEDDNSTGGFYFVYDVAVNTAKGLYNCDASTHECAKESTIGHGYYSHEGLTTQILMCDGNTCSETDDLTKSDCTNSADKYKVIYHSGLQYCDNESEIDLSSMTTKKYYAIPDVLGSSITYPTSFITDTNGNHIVVEVQKYAVIQYVSATPFCIRSDAFVAEGECNNGEIKYTCSNATSPCSEESVSLSACTKDTAEERCNGFYLDNTNLVNCSNGSCDSPLSLKGYFKSPSGMNIKCTTTDGLAFTCADADSITDDISSLTGEVCTVGKLIKDGDIISLCVDGKKANAPQIFTTSTDKYFIPASILYTGKGEKLHFMISIDEKSVQVVDITSTSKKYRYTFANKKVLVKKANQCTADSGSTINDLVEFSSPDATEDTYTMQ
jgi:hypothetical protein